MLQSFILGPLALAGAALFYAFDDMPLWAALLMGVIGALNIAAGFWFLKKNRDLKKLL